MVCLFDSNVDAIAGPSPPHKAVQVKQTVEPETCPEGTELKKVSHSGKILTECGRWYQNMQKLNDELAENVQATVGFDMMGQMRSVGRTILRGFVASIKDQPETVIYLHGQQ